MRHWPSTTLLAKTEDQFFRRMVVGSNRLRAGVLMFPARSEVPDHQHLESDEIFFIIEGSATFTIEDSTCVAEAGDMVFVGAAERHAIHTHDQPLIMLAAVAPNLDDAWVTGHGHLPRLDAFEPDQEERPNGTYSAG